MTARHFDRRRVIAGLGTTVLMGCGRRGAFVPTAPGQSDRILRSVLYVTNRIADPASPSAVARGSTLRFSLLDIATPRDRLAGSLDFTGPDAFTLADRTPVDQADLADALHQSTVDKKPGHTRLMLWVHGFNNTPAEAVHRQVQVVQDLAHAGATVSFVWPSAARSAGYIHDRDSALHARDLLADLLVQLRAAWSGEIVVVAHSLGAFLTLEAI